VALAVVLPRARWRSAGRLASAAKPKALEATDIREECEMSLLVVLIILLLLFGGGGFYMGGPRVGGSLGGLILLILIVLLLTGRL